MYPEEKIYDPRNPVRLKRDFTRIGLVRWRHGETAWKCTSRLIVICAGQVSGGAFIHYTVSQRA
jgi:hypothetical protein